MIDWIESWRRASPSKGDPDRVRDLPTNEAVVAIDPGAHGAAVFSVFGERVHAVALGRPGACNLLEYWTLVGRPRTIVIESQYTSRQQQFAATDIALRAGLVVGLITAVLHKHSGNAPHIVHVAPQTWQGHIGITRDVRADRKKLTLKWASPALIALSQDEVESEQVRRAASREGVADALGILHWWRSGARLHLKARSKA